MVALHATAGFVFIPLQYGLIGNVSVAPIWKTGLDASFILYVCVAIFFGSPRCPAFLDSGLEVMNFFPEIPTERLILRELRTGDLDALAEINADPRVMEYFPGILSRAESDAFAGRIRNHWEKYGFGQWGVERREDGAFLGITGLSRPRFEAHFTPCVEVGWRLAVRYWGKGYATEAAKAAVRLGFERLGLDEIVSFTVPQNSRSRRVMEKLGMSRSEADDFDHPNLPERHPLRRHVLYRIQRIVWAASSPPTGR